MKTWTPLWSSIVNSSIWSQSKESKILWVTMLAIKDSEGFVESSIPGLARMAVLSLQECEEALAVLEGPDKYSRSPENEGRKIKRVPGGWMILNHTKYRDEVAVERRKAYQRRKQAEYRANKAPRNGKPLPGENAYVRAESDGAPEEVLDGVIERNLSR